MLFFISACGGTINSYEGAIASPNYPNSYPLNIACVWEIKASPGNIINLIIPKLNIDYSDNCADDYLEIREGGSIGKVLGVYCGNEPTRNVTSAEVIWIKFKSSNQGASTGFLAEFSYAKTVELYQSEGFIATPLYPNYYFGSYEHTYRITVPFGYDILLSYDDYRFSSFYEEECPTFVKVQISLTKFKFKINFFPFFTRFMMDLMIKHLN